MALAERALTIASLEIDADRLKNSLAHLQRSQSELRAALQDDPADEDFLQALRDNEDTIRDKERALHEMEMEIEFLRQLEPDGGSQTDLAGAMTGAAAGAAPGPAGADEPSAAPPGA